MFLYDINLVFLKLNLINSNASKDRGIISLRAAVL